ncbi:MAG: M48 family metalloprotease [bacterium]|nr:M48 family metalloprotease [bacterium]
MNKLFGLLFFIAALSSCGSSWIPTKVDKTLGELSNQEIINAPNQFPILDKEECAYAYERVELIRDEIINSGELDFAQDFNWEVKIIKDDSVLNAFCLPGGNFYIYTGLIKYLDSEAALAGVIGHEMAHADKRHSTKHLVQNMSLSLILQYFIGVDQSSLLGLGANLLSLSFNRLDESEADMQSVSYLNKTKYDPRGAAFFFEKIEKENKSLGPIEFMSTHPDPENRVKKIYKKWKDLGAKKGKLNKEEYKKIISDLP